MQRTQQLCEGEVLVRSLKVLHVAIGLEAEWGGPPRGLASLARAQVELDDRVTVLSCVDGGGEKVLPAGHEGGLEVIQLPVRGSLLLPCHRVLNAMADLAPRIDIVHIHGTWRYHSIAASRMARQHGIPYLLRPAGNLGEITFGHKAFAKNIYWWLFEKRVADAASLIHCCSQKERDEIERLNIRAASIVVPMPVDRWLLDIEPDQAGLHQLIPRLAEPGPVILYLGRLDWIKRLPLLVEAFGSVARQFSQVSLVLAGPASTAACRQQLQAKIRQVGVADCTFLPGMVDGGVKAALYQRATIFAQPSAHENFGQSVAEALLFGLPCVVSDGVALGKDIQTAGAGTICTGSVKAFATALAGLLIDSARYQQCREGARQVADSFRPERIAGRLHEIYESIIEPGHTDPTIAEIVDN